MRKCIQLKNSLKSLLTIFGIIFFVFQGIGQDEIKPPDLDVNKQTYTLKFSPDPDNEKVLSAYMKGTTEKDSLRFWAEGTPLLQNVMVTVLTQNKEDKVKVDIVKDHWHDSKINQQTTEGLFQEAFKTANKFGVVVTSEEPDVPFHLAVWTTAEPIPDMKKLYYPASEFKGKSKTTSSLENTSSPQVEKANSNSLIYIVIAVLVVIAGLLLALLLKMKARKSIAILILFIFSQQMLIADASISSPSDFNTVLRYAYENAGDVQTFMERANSVSNEIQRQLGSSDNDARPQMNPRGGPRLPSSCLNSDPGAVDQNEDSYDSRLFTSAGCQCLADAYEVLDRRRLNLERLRIIYSSAMEKINAGIAFGDDVSAVHGVSGLVWQSQKMIILKESIPNLNKAYDDKYLEMMEALEEILQKIGDCESQLGFEDWYNMAGFIYYQFMVDKYKRN